MAKKTPAQKIEKLEALLKERELVWKEKESSNQEQDLELDKIRLVLEVMREMRVKDEVKGEEFPFENTWKDQDEINFFKKTIIKLIKNLTKEKNHATLKNK